MAVGEVIVVEPVPEATEDFHSVELPQYAAQQEESSLDTLNPLLDADSLMYEFLSDILSEGNRFLLVSTAIGVC